MNEPTATVSTPDIDPARAQHNVYDLCQHARSVPGKIDELSTEVAGLLSYAYRFQQATLHTGILEPAVGIHRITLALANVQSTLLESIDLAVTLSSEVREFARARELKLVPPEPASALPPGYPAKITVGPMHAVRRVGGGIMGVFADPEAADEFAEECRDEGYEVVIEPPPESAEPEQVPTDDEASGAEDTEQP